MSIKKTKDQFINDAKNIHNDKYDYSLFEYVNCQTKGIIICKKHNCSFNQTPNNHVSNKQGCPICANDKIIKLKTKSKELILNKLNELNNNYIYNLNDYKNMNSKISIICDKNHIFKQKVSNIINKKYSCPICSKNKKLTTEILIKKSKEIFKDNLDYSLTQYVNARTKIKLICKKHNYIFEKTPNNHISKKQGCPICEESKGETIIRNYLLNENIKFIKQKRFNKCKNIRPLPFDFYLPNYNICIEYDGEQHINEKHYFNTKNIFKDQKIRDKIKTDYCLNNNIKLIRIRYDEDIEKTLKEKINLF